MNFMNKATTHSQTSLLKWQKQNRWIERATDYDNARADQIMMRDVSIITQYQQDVTKAGLEDMQMLRATWQQLYEQVMTGRDAEGNMLSAREKLDALKTLTDVRMKLDQLARVTTRMPAKYNPIRIEETDESMPEEYIQLTFKGPEVMELGDGKHE